MELRSRRSVEGPLSRRFVETFRVLDPLRYITQTIIADRRSGQCSLFFRDCIDVTVLVSHTPPNIATTSRFKERHGWISWCNYKGSERLATFEMIATRGNCAFASIDEPGKVGSSQSRRPDGNGGRDTVTALRPHSNPKRPPVVCRSPKAEPLHRIAAQHGISQQPGLQHAQQRPALTI
jgi:hypothetical protein